MDKELRASWEMMVKKIQMIDKLRRRVEEDDLIDLEKVSGTILEGLNGRIRNNLIETESFLREVIKEAKK